MVAIPEAVQVAAVLAVPGAVWWEIRGLRRARHDHSNQLTALSLGQQQMQRDVDGLKEDMRQVRDGLIRAGIIYNGGEPHA